MGFLSEYCFSSIFLGKPSQTWKMTPLNTILYFDWEITVNL